MIFCLIQGRTPTPCSARCRAWPTSRGLRRRRLSSTPPVTPSKLSGRSPCELAARLCRVTRCKKKTLRQCDTLIDLQCVFFSARILRETSSVPLDHDPRRSRGDVHRGRPPALGVGHRSGQGAEQARPQSSEPEIQGNINTYQN